MGPIKPIAVGLWAHEILFFTILNVLNMCKWQIKPIEAPTKGFGGYFIICVI